MAEPTQQSAWLPIFGLASMEPPTLPWSSVMSQGSDSLDGFEYNPSDLDSQGSSPHSAISPVQQFSSLASLGSYEKLSEVSKWNDSMLALHCSSPVHGPGDDHPLKCCNYQYASVSTFERHRRESCKKLRDAPKLFKCDHCGKGFGRRCNLKQHLVEVAKLSVRDAYEEIKRKYSKGMRRQRSGGRRI